MKNPRTIRRWEGSTEEAMTGIEWLLAPGRRDHSSSEIQRREQSWRLRREGDWQKWFSGQRVRLWRQVA